MDAPALDVPGYFSATCIKSKCHHNIFQQALLHQLGNSMINSYARWSALKFLVDKLFDHKILSHTRQLMDREAKLKHSTYKQNPAHAWWENKWSKWQLTNHLDSRMAHGKTSWNCDDFVMTTCMKDAYK